MKEVVNEGEDAPRVSDGSRMSVEKERVSRPSMDSQVRRRANEMEKHLEDCENNAHLVEAARLSLERMRVSGPDDEMNNSVAVSSRFILRAVSL